MTTPTPFTVTWADADVADVLRRVREYPFPVAPIEGGWGCGTDPAFLRELCAHWTDGYDWRAAVADLNRFPQFTARVEDFDLHFVHIVGEAGGKRPLLLYIEDNEVNLLIVSELMRQRADLQFLSAVDGASGLAVAREQQPVLILLDMQLPDMDGHEVLRRLRADPATAAIRCIALSANAMPEDIRRALADGFDDYWTKPLDLQAFLRSIDALFGRPVVRPALSAAG